MWRQPANHPLHRIRIPTEFFWKWSFFDPKQQLLNNVEPFERILRASLIAQCPYKFSSFLDLRNGSSRFRLFARDFRLFRFFFSRSACFSKVASWKFAKLSEILWKICKFWKRISMDYIQCGGEVYSLSHRFIAKTKPLPYHYTTD